MVSFRKDMIIIQTMTKPFDMPSVGTKGLYTTNKEYEFECNHEKVNVMVSKVLLVGGFKCRRINVVRGDPLGANGKSSIEVTFDWFDKDRDFEVQTKVGDSFGIHISKPYPHFLINSFFDYEIQEKYLSKLNNSSEIQTILVDNPKAFKSFYSHNFRIFVGFLMIVIEVLLPGLV